MELTAGDYCLDLAPERGGSILRFDWRGEPLLRRASGPSILDVACFPLVPFSNRIAYGRFAANGREVRLSPNLPASDHPHPLHGFGWQAVWQVVEQDGASAVLEHACASGEWPWAYCARQSFCLSGEGLTVALALTNLADTPMPAGLGFHPYFPRTATTIYHGLHRGQWRNDADCLPQRLEQHSVPRDWWEGAAVAARAVDTVYTGREGVLTIRWPDRGMAVTMTPSAELGFTVVYSPQGENWFCVEPVSHMTDAVNHARDDSGLVWLAGGETMSASLTIQAKAC